MVKYTDDATRQVEWLQRVDQTGTVDGVRAVPVLGDGDGRYLMEYVPGSVLADISDTERMSRSVLFLLAQVDAWSQEHADNDADWTRYLDRLNGHAAHAGSSVAARAVEAVAAGSPFPRSWCHGDLTLENVLLDGSGIVLIDPNYQPDLYQSYILDYGKILQSTHTSFHRSLSPRVGALGAAREMVEKHLRERDQYDQALRACLSHTVRLLKHWPSHLSEIETGMDELMREISAGAGSRSKRR